MPKLRMATLLSCLICTACSTVDVARVLDATFIVVPEAGAAGPVGTAVALDDGTFVTAAHVLNGIVGSRYTQPFLYHQPETYAIDEIVRYSQLDDFVVFNVKPSPGTGLKPSVTLSANEALPAVGERLYIAAHTSDSKKQIRNGLTLGVGTVEALTPREESAHRQWFALRAYTSQGMSGGAIIDPHGQVLGILTEQDPNAPPNDAGTRNRATSMKAVLARDVVTADIWPQRALYAFGLYDYVEVLGTREPTVFAPAFFDSENAAPTPISMDRPMPYAEFAAQVIGIRERYFERAFEPWLRSGGARVLTDASAAAAATCELLNAMPCSRVSAGARDVVLNVEAPQPIVYRGAHPTTFSARLDGALLLRRKTAEPVTLDTLYPADSQVSSPTGIALRADPRWRDRYANVEAEAKEADVPYTDLHGREWRLHSLTFRMHDLQLLTLARPVHDGYVALFRLVPTSLAHAATLHLKVLANLDSVAQ
jgi:hypothetical protein